MVQIPKWNKELDKLLEDYFKEDGKGNSKRIRDYYDKVNKPLLDINNYMTRLYRCLPEERWERVTEQIPIKWYRKILNTLEKQDDETEI